MGSTAALIRSGILIWEVLWCWSLWRLWRGTSWQGHGRDVVVWWQWCSRKPPSNRHKWRFSVQKNVMPSCWWLASWWWVYQIYIYTNNIHPICHKAARNGVGICESEGRQTSRFQKSNVACIFEPQGFGQENPRNRCFGVSPLLMISSTERGILWTTFWWFTNFLWNIPEEKWRSQKTCVFFPKIRHSSGVLLTELKTDVINGGIRLIPLFADSMVVRIYGKLGHCKSTQ